MGFPSPASDYVEQRLSVNLICNVGPNTRVFERDGGYVVLDISLKPKQGSQVLIQHGGGTEPCHAERKVADNRRRRSD